MRINKYIASSGYCSRRKADELIKAGKVSINDRVLDDLSYQVKAGDIVRVNGKILKEEEKFIYIALNKPVGYVSTTKDPHAEKTVTDLVDFKSRLYPIGRLDKDSRGLIILSNDGDLTYELTHPSFNHSKEYEVLIDSPIKKAEIEALENGPVIDGYKLNKSKIQVIKSKKNSSLLRIIISEGRNRQIRKMFKSIGKNVIDLKRVRIGNYRLEDLKEGSYRVLDKDDINKLRGKDDRS
ncbi:MAG: pseudouridine synthase [Finegoldia sp.]|nr:pseudouridine synthase [Finegoldia sp.]